MQDHLLPQRMPQLPATSGRLVVWERTRSWRRFFLNQVRCAPSRGQIDAALLADQAMIVASADELHAVIENHPASFVFAEVAVADFRELLGQFPRFRRSMPRLRMAVVCLELPERPVDESNVLDSLFREAGVTAVLATQRDLLAMIPAVLMHFSTLPQQEPNWRELIELRLPWRSQDSGKSKLFDPSEPRR